MMIKKSIIILFVVIVFASLTFATEENQTKYTFDEPEDLFFKVTEHIGKSHPCPKNNTIEEIKDQITKRKLADKFTNQDFQTFKEECETFDFYNIPSIEPPKKIKNCYDNLVILLQSENISLPHDVQLYTECYTRDYFEQRFNNVTIADYNKSYFKSIFDERDEEYKEFIKLKNEYGGFRRNEKEKVETAKQNATEQNVPGNYGKDIKRTNITLTEEGAIEGEDIRVKKISPSLKEEIKKKIKNFLEWFS
jgi:hypothetical protein